ncbi:unnamed protein product [Clonostachys rhizophaga]|uniref:DUF6535 domain-containing protein n=1 Tax=Clonostachys rhizophaga TaxID=160324 RepID=A0A9N9V1W7_9HYPO|nr:unnamed protein product [Clonostachys rhizophaga]
MSTQPLLGQHTENGTEPRPKRRKFPRRFLSSLLTAQDGIEIMLQCEDGELRDELTKRWRDHKLEELNFVGTVGALLASCLSSTSAWPNVLNNGRDKPWTVRALWFSGLVFALFSVLVAGLQSMRLHRLSAHRDGLRKIRAGLCGSKPGGVRRPGRAQVYSWEASPIFLLLSVALMVIGIAVLVWVSAAYGPNKPEHGIWWDENAKMAVTFTVVLCFAVSVLLASQAALSDSESKDAELDE